MYRVSHMQCKRVLIIDDHALFRTGMKLILTQVGKIDEVIEASTIKEAFSLKSQNFDIILSDIHMPGLNGIDGIKPLKEKFGSTPIVILSASTDSNDANQAKLFGAAGFMNKAAAADEMIAQIRRVIAGKKCFGDIKIEDSLNFEQKISSKLTTRQIEVLIHLCEGLPNKTIARELDMSENTVRVHVSAILNTLGASNRTEAIVIAQREGLTS